MASDTEPDWVIDLSVSPEPRIRDPRLAITRAAFQGMIKQFKPMARTMDAIEETVRSMHRDGVQRVDLLELGYSEAALDKVLAGESIIEWPYR